MHKERPCLDCGAAIGAKNAKCRGPIRCHTCMRKRSNRLALALLRKNPAKLAAKQKRNFLRHIEDRRRWAAKRRAAGIKTNRSPEGKAAERARNRSPKRYAKNREWFKNHPEMNREYCAQAKARKLNAFVAPVDREAVFHRDNGRCWICKKIVHHSDRSIDHVIPLIKGGEHSPQNVRLAHMRCNSSKNDTILTLF